MKEMFNISRLFWLTGVSLLVSLVLATAPTQGLSIISPELILERSLVATPTGIAVEFRTKTWLLASDATDYLFAGSLRHRVVSSYEFCPTGGEDFYGSLHSGILRFEGEGFNGQYLCATAQINNSYPVEAYRLTWITAHAEIKGIDNTPQLTHVGVSPPRDGNLSHNYLTGDQLYFHIAIPNYDPWELYNGLEGSYLQLNMDGARAQYYNIGSDGLDDRSWRLGYTPIRSCFSWLPRLSAVWNQNSLSSQIDYSDSSCLVYRYTIKATDKTDHLRILDLVTTSKHYLRDKDGDQASLSLSPEQLSLGTPLLTVNKSESSPPPVVSVSSGSAANSFKARDDQSDPTSWNYAFINQATTCGRHVSFSTDYSEGANVGYSASNNGFKVCFRSTEAAGNHGYGVSTVINLAGGSDPAPKKPTKLPDTGSVSPWLSFVTITLISSLMVSWLRARRGLNS